MQGLRYAVPAAVLLSMVLALLPWSPVPQDPAYHDFADQRELLGIPNGLNVLSNIPIAAVGLLGLALLFRSRFERPRFGDPWERWPYATVFAACVLTALGSAYYHLEPSNGRLVWDRMPMTVCFMGLLTAVVSERLSPRLGRWLLVPLLGGGIGSVVYWHYSELRGAGDLRPYILVQFGSLLVLALLLTLYRARYSGTGFLFAGLAAYAAAKALEVADQPVFALGGIVSGHTLKHLAAAAAAACIAAMLHKRAERLE